MKKLKKIMLSVCLLLLVFCFSGCANIEYQRIVNTDGSIIDAVCVKLDEQKLTEKNYNITKVTSDIISKMNGYINSIVASFYNRDDGLTTIEKVSVYNNIVTTATEKNGYIIASIKFKNYSTFKYFYGLHLNEDSNNEDNIVKDFLFNKNVSAGKTIFAGKDAEFITNEFLTYFNNDFTLDDADLSYLFGTTESKMHSDATIQFTQNNINYHQWIINDINQEITTFYYQMKPVNWYILALSLTLGLTLILFAIVLIKNFINKRKNIKQ